LALIASKLDCWESDSFIDILRGDGIAMICGDQDREVCSLFV
jgi:hypothetical protein